MSDLILKGSTTPCMSLGSSGSANMQFNSTTEKRLVEMIEAEAATRAAADETLENSKADKSNTYTKDEIDNKEADIWSELDYLAEATRVIDIPYEDLLVDEGITAFCQNMVSNNNREYRLPELTILSIEFEDAEYDRAYMSSLSFDSGATPTAIDYADSGILNWVGTDCSMTNDGLSIFQPSANTHYDIVFYFNGKQFIGLVNGYVSSIEWQGALPTGNEEV